MKPVVVCLMSCYIQHMARGQSGRLVLEIDPALKRQLHARVAADGRTLKDWFLEQAELYLRQQQRTLPFLEGGRAVAESGGGRL